MDTELLEIIPRELKFTIELKKQSSCSVQLVNISDQYVAFKVKTTSPKKYCVRPNTGIIHPKSTCDFTVTMQAQRVAPPDMQCKDKFLIQGTIVPFGTAAEAITSGTFAKNNGKYIEENKLKVILVSPSDSPILRPINGVLKEDYEASTIRDQLWSEFENLSSLNKVLSKEHVKPSNDTEELKPAKDMIDMKQTEDVEFKLAEDVEKLKPATDMVDMKQAKDVDFKLPEDVEELKPAKVEEEYKNTNNEELMLAKDVRLKTSKEPEEKMNATKNVEVLELAKDVEELKLKVKELEAKLNGAETTITTLREERSTTNIERETLQQQLTMVRRRNVARRDQVGFPFLFVCVVALVGIAVGYLLRKQRLD